MFVLPSQTNCFSLCFLFAGRELAELDKGARHAQVHAFALGMFENYQSQWVIYLNFCLKFGLVALPASSLVLVWFTQYLTRRLKVHGSLSGYLSGVKKLHLFTGHNTKAFHSFVFKLTLQGMWRMNEYVLKQAAPMMPRILELMHKQLDHQDKFDVIFWCALIFAFFLLFRKSNLVLSSKDGFNPNKQLKCTDLVFTGKNIIVGIRWAKNEQFLKELMMFPLPIIPGSPLCPLQAVTNIFRMVRMVKPDAHLFSFSDGSSLTYNQFQTKLRVVLEAAGIQNFKDYSSHSYH